MWSKRKRGNLNVSWDLQKEMSTWNESVRKLTQVSVASCKPWPKAGNCVRQGKMRIKVYLKTRKKRGKWLHALINMGLDIMDRNGLTFKLKRWPKTIPCAVWNLCDYTFYVPTPTLRIFPPRHYLHPIWLPSQLCYEYTTWGRWCWAGIKSKYPTSQITQVSQLIMCMMVKVE